MQASLSSKAYVKRVNIKYNLYVCRIYKYLPFFSWLCREFRAKWVWALWWGNSQEGGAAVCLTTEKRNAFTTPRRKCKQPCKAENSTYKLNKVKYAADSYVSICDKNKLPLLHKLQRFASSSATVHHSSSSTEIKLKELDSCPVPIWWCCQRSVHIWDQWLSIFWNMSREEFCSLSSSVQSKKKSHISKLNAKGWMCMTIVDSVFCLISLTKSVIFISSWLQHMSCQPPVF